jgi:tetratricopeptide (TPR) repeat protein
MGFSRAKPLTVFVLMVALLAGCGAVAYARWTKPLLDAERALAAGQREAALDAYAAAERRLGRFRLVQYAFAAQYSSSVYNQLALLYDAGKYDAVLEKATTAPPGAAPHFWSGVVLLARAVAEKNPDARLVGLSRAEDALRQALQASPDDWDTKFNYEIAARLAAEMRREPRKKTDTPLQLLRPQPTRGQPTRRVG